MLRKLRRNCIILVRRFSVYIIIFTIGYLLFQLSRIGLSYSKKELLDASRNIINRIFYNEISDGEEDEENEVSKKMISRLIKTRNKEQIIRNIDDFGRIVNDTTILVIMADNKNVNDLKIITSSLERMQGIEQLLVIFSHSYYDEPLNKIIGNIDYCRVLQIYYPFSTQLHPNEFPGLSFNNCPYNRRSNRSARSNCSKTDAPGIKCPYRVSHKTQKKHHWWWTANTVFEKLSFSTEHTGLVIFVDDFVVFIKDFIYMVTYMKNIANSQSRCEFLSFGSKYLSTVNEKDFYGIELSFWNPKNDLNLLGFDVSVWNSIVPHYDLFCSFDDWSWIRSLYYISLNRKDGKRYKTLSSLVPRVFRAHSCMLIGRLNCDMSHNLDKIEVFEDRNVDNWFPPFLELYINLDYQEDDDIYDIIEGKGGFADPRDKTLCHNLTVSKIKKVVLEMKYEYRDSI